MIDAVGSVQEQLHKVERDKIKQQGNQVIIKSIAVNRYNGTISVVMALVQFGCYQHRRECM